MLRWHVCRVNFARKIFVRATNFLTKNAPKLSPNFLSLCSVGQKKIPGKFPPNFPLNFPNFPAKNQKKITNELLQERRENCMRTRAKTGEHSWVTIYVFVSRQGVFVWDFFKSSRIFWQCGVRFTTTFRPLGGIAQKLQSLIWYACSLPWAGRVHQKDGSSQLFFGQRRLWATDHVGKFR